MITEAGRCGRMRTWFDCLDGSIRLSACAKRLSFCLIHETLLSFQNEGIHDAAVRNTFQCTESHSESCRREGNQSCCVQIGATND